MDARAPEFSRIVRLDAIARMRWPAHIEANEAERELLARRFGYIAIDRLTADYSLARDGKNVTATGAIGAHVTQACVATGEPVAEEIDEPFAIRFEPEAANAPSASSEEQELEADECDVLPMSGDRIDMGEVVAETLALAVSPYPRAADAERRLRDAGVLSEDQAGPFAALAALRDRPTE